MRLPQDTPVVTLVLVTVTQLALLVGVLPVMHGDGAPVKAAPVLCEREATQAAYMLAFAFCSLAKALALSLICKITD
jgi:hypothetical protein